MFRVLLFVRFSTRTSHFVSLVLIGSISLSGIWSLLVGMLDVCVVTLLCRTSKFDTCTSYRERAITNTPIRLGWSQLNNTSLCRHPKSLRRQSQRDFTTSLPPRNSQDNSDDNFERYNPWASVLIDTSRVALSLSGVYGSGSIGTLCLLLCRWATTRKQCVVVLA